VCSIEEKKKMVQAVPGDTAWMLTSSALTFLMTPGLAFFYGGLVSQKNVLNTLMMSFSAGFVITLEWFLFGYTLAFAPPANETQSIWGEVGMTRTARCL